MIANLKNGLSNLTQDLWKRFLTKISRYGLTLGVIIIVFFVLFFLINSWNSVADFFDISNQEVVNQNNKNKDRLDASISASLNETKKSISSESNKVIQRMDSIGKMDCYNLDSSWVADEEVRFTNQLFILKDGATVGSARYHRPFNNQFVLDFSFIPSALFGINTTISIKDINSNELAITIGDGDFRRIRTVYNKLGEKNKDINEQLPNNINPTKEVKLRIQTVQKATTVLIAGTIKYSPQQKPDLEMQPEDILGIELPNNFINTEVFLNLGLKKSDREAGEKNLRVIDCSIQQIS